MGKNKTDKLEALFAEMRPESPSVDFESGLMAKISSKAEARRNRMQWAYMLLLPSIAVAAIIAALLLVDRFTGIEMGLNRLKVSIGLLSEYSGYIILVVLILILLITDSLIRRRLNRKRVSHS